MNLDIRKLIKIKNSLSKNTKKNFPYLIFFTIISSFFEILTIGSIMPVITIFIFPDILFELKIIEQIYNQMSLNLNEFRVIIIFLFIILILLSTFCRIILLYYNINVSKLITSDLSSSLFNSYIFNNYEDIASFKSNKIVASTTEKLEIFSNIMFHFFNFFSSIILSVAIICSLIIFSDINIILSLIIFVGVIYLALIFLTKTKLSKYSEYTNYLSNLRVKNLQDCLNNYKNIILENSMKSYSKFFFDLDYNYRKTQAKISLIGYLPRFLIEALSIIIITVITFFFLSKNNFENTSGIILSVGIVVFGAQKLLPIFQSIYLAYTSIKGNMGMINEIINSINTNKEINPDLNNKRKDEFKSLKLENINFKYQQNDKLVLSNINLSINKGDKIAIIGQSGSGKSTLVDIIMGLLKPSNGNILFNDVNIDFDTDKFELRKNFSHVPQNYFILNETIKDNILFSISKNKYIDENKLNKAIECSELGGFISNFQKGLDTIIGEKGANISGGQRQRIALARAFYQEKNILVLDEATSSLDYETEKKIIYSLKELYSELTVLFITHKKNLLGNFNKIINLDE